MSSVNVNINTNQVTVTQPNTQVVEVTSFGPMGPQGPAGPVGPMGSGSAGPFIEIIPLLWYTTSSIQFSSSVDITGSLFLIGNSTFNGSLFTFIGDTDVTGSFKVNTGFNKQPAMQVNNEGIFIIGEYSTTPTPVRGGLIFSGSEYFLGF